MNFLIFFIFFLLLPTSRAFAETGNTYTEGYKPVQTTGIFSVFSTKTIPREHIAVDMGMDIMSRPDVQRFRLNTAFGITDNLEAGLSAAYVFVDHDDGIEDLSLGLRYRFLEEISFGPSAAVLLTLSLPAGKEDKRFGTGDTEVGGLLILSKRIGPFTGHGNVGYNIVNARHIEDDYILSGGLEFQAAKRLKLFGELYSRTSQDKDEYEVRFGYQALFPGDIYNTVGIGYGINDRNPDYRVTVLFTYILPRVEEPLIRVQEP